MGFRALDLHGFWRRGLCPKDLHGLRFGVCLSGVGRAVLLGAVTWRLLIIRILLFRVLCYITLNEGYLIWGSL